MNFIMNDIKFIKFISQNANSCAHKAKEMISHSWWMSFGAQTPEHIAVRVLSQVTSAGSCETNWSTFDFIHSKKRNRLACPTVRNIVTVHCNLRLVDRIKELGHCDDNIDWSSDGDSSE